jgi:hypothetical protein
MSTLASIKHSRNTDEIAETLAAATIFDKMEFSNITKEQVKEKLHYLETVQVPNRTVLLKADDESLVFAWLKNWIHPKLKHAAPKAPADKRGCTRRVLAIDNKMDSLNFYENGQQNFSYTLADIKNWLDS